MESQINISVWQEDLGQTRGPGSEEKSAPVASLFLDTRTEGLCISSGPKAGSQAVNGQYGLGCS